MSDTRSAFTPGTGRHVPALDGVRGLAILLVLVLHVSESLSASASPVTRLFGAVASIGWTGVDLFFVLSGFLITGILYDTRRRPNYFRNFYARRVLRIFPLYFLVLAVVLGLVPRLLPGQAVFPVAPDKWSWGYWTYMTNVAIAQHGWPGRLALGHFWSLAVEEQFYLVWPLVVLVFARRGVMGVCLALVVASPLVRLMLPHAHQMLGIHNPWTAAYVLTPARMDALAAGALVALAARGPSGLWPFRRAACWAIGASLTLLAALAVWRNGLFYEDSVVQATGFTALVVLFSSLLIVTLTQRKPGLASVFERPELRFLGRYSYALYVFHYPLLFVIPPAALFSVMPFTPGLAADALYAVAVSALAIALSVISWHVLEKHFLRLKELFPYLRDVRAVPGTADKRVLRVQLDS